MHIDRLPKNLHVAIAYKNFAIQKGISHIGLGVSALNNAKVLEAHGIKTAVVPTQFPADLINQIKAAAVAGTPFTHVIISAPWIPTPELAKMCQTFPMITFYVNCHSNVGFLQADSGGVKLIREYIDLEQGQLNFHMAGNSKRFVTTFKAAYQCPISYLPNMYYTDYSNVRNQNLYHDGGVLRIGAFGAVRPQKNVMTSAAAAIVLSNTLKADVELYISGGRFEGGGQVVVNSIREMVANVPGIKLIESNWASWSSFRDTIRRMHLLLQVSYTESFNMVTADGIVEGVPSVVSEAIDWAPSDWTAHFDDAFDVASVGRKLIYDRFAGQEGLKALEKHNHNSYNHWMKALHVRSHKPFHLSVKDPIN